MTADTSEDVAVVEYIHIHISSEGRKGRGRNVAFHHLLLSNLTTEAVYTVKGKGKETFSHGELICTYILTGKQ